MEEAEFSSSEADGVLSRAFLFRRRRITPCNSISISPTRFKMAIAIYHNPQLHRVTIPVSAFQKLVTRPNIVMMKDIHRKPIAFMELMKITQGKLSVFCNQSQCYPYMQFGAVGCWSIPCRAPRR
jgi:hypothetical protein